MAEYCGLVTLAIPYSPVAGPLGFKALPPLYLLIDPVPRIALDAKNKQFANADREGTIVVQL